MQVEQVRGDVADAAVVARAVEGCGTVFHTAAKAGIWGPEREYHRANVEGTRNVIAACRAAGVPPAHLHELAQRRFQRPRHGRRRRVGALFDPFRGRLSRDEGRSPSSSSSRPIPTAWRRSSLRPHLIWGPGDNNLLPRIIARARSGRLRRIGRTNALIDPIYIDNAAEAHLLAADRLEPGSPVAGKAYFITQGETIPLWDMIDHLLKAAQHGTGPAVDLAAAGPGRRRTARGDLPPLRPAATSRR